MSQVLARKYRPRGFDQLIGQDHVAQALTNALINNRLHHAYLFVGTRGVGKTSIARILARCLNCVDGPTATPCLSCPPCVSIEEGRFVDLIEVDAASRTKVEDTRELLENVQYAPSEGRFKVYLIDEVHMLSNSSFNALLKTLEEPPAHVKFLLATTNPEKVPVTVLSRCLQFKLRDLPADRIAAHLAEVLGQENLSYELPALEAIGRAARGSIRDAMTLTDQAIAFTDGQIETQAVNDMLGIQGQDGILDLLQAIAEGDATAALAWIREVAQVDPDWTGLVQAMQRALHDMAVQAATGQSTSMSAEVIQLNYSLATQGFQELPVAPEPRLGFEMTVLKMLAFRPATAGEYPDPKAPAAEAATESSTPAPSATPTTDSQPTVTPVTEQPQVRAPEPVAAPIVEPQPEPELSASLEPEPEPELSPEPVTVTPSEPTEAAAPPWDTSSSESAQPHSQVTAEQLTDALHAGELAGMALATLSQGEVVSLDAEVLTLRLPPESQTLFMDHHRDDALSALTQGLGMKIRSLNIEWAPVQGKTPNDILHERAAIQLQNAKDDFRAEPLVQWLSQNFDGEVQEASVEPRSE